MLPRTTGGLKELAGSLAFAAWRLLTRNPIDRSRYSGFLAAATYTPWRADAEFLATHRAVAQHTMVPVSKLHELWTITGQLTDLSGDILEVGAWRGGSGCLLAARSAKEGSPARVFIADTFSGVVKAGKEDLVYRGGEHSDTSPEVVRELARSIGLENVEILVGIFPDETGSAIEARLFKLVHVDVDTYRSVREVTEWVWPRLEIGGVIVYDDYGAPTTPGAREAVDEFRGRPGALVLHNMNQHGLIVKFR